MRDTGVLDRLRKRGLVVIEVDGWRERGSSTFDPRGSVDHHTAGGINGNAPSLGICINGRRDLPGPLCNVLVGRDNTCYLVAAGRANHAGRGGWRGLSGNSSVFGVERENVGTAAEPWRPDQTETAARVHAALIEGRSDASLVCRHAEWAPGRKIDTHDISGDDLRARVQAVMAGAPQAPVPAPPPVVPPASSSDHYSVEAIVADLPVIRQNSNQRQHVLILQGLLVANGRKVAIDGAFGPGTHAAVINFQQATGLGDDGIVGPRTWRRLLCI